MINSSSLRSAVYCPAHRRRSRSAVYCPAPLCVVLLAQQSGKAVIAMARNNNVFDDEPEEKLEKEFEDALFVKRRKLLYMLQYIMENADEEHYVSANEIIEHLYDEYLIDIDRKTVYADIRLLRAYGYEVGIDIEDKKSTKGYRVLRREFELDELQLIIDCIQATRFITDRKAKELTDKLKKLTSRHNRPILDRRAYVTNRIRNMNNSVFRGVENIHAAIADDKRITFKYFNYNTKKEKEYSKKAYIASPYALLWSDGNYYLMAFEGGKMKHFRVDRMDNIKLTDEKREGKSDFKAINLSERATKVFAMYGGKEERVKLRFSNRLAGVVIERFGSDIMIMPDDGTHFIVNVVVEVSPQFFGWLCGLGKGVKLLFPAPVVEQYRAFVNGIAGMYAPDIETNTAK